MASLPSITKLLATFLYFSPNNIPSILLTLEGGGGGGVFPIMEAKPKKGYLFQDLRNMKG